MKERIRSIQPVIKLLGKHRAGGKKQANMKLVQSIQLCFRKRRKRKIAREITNKKHV